MITKLFKEEQLIFQIPCLYYNDFQGKYFNGVIACDNFKLYVFETNSVDRKINDNFAYSFPRLELYFNDVSLIVDEKLHGLKKYKNMHRVNILANLSFQSLLLFYYPYQKDAYKALYRFLKLHKIKINYSRTNAKKYI